MIRSVQRLLLFAIAALVVAADQYAKALVRARLTPFETWSPVPALADYFTLINTTNTGAAFGMFKNAGGIFTVVAGLVAALIVFYYRRIPDGEIAIRVALGLQLGGAIGNLIDRLRFGTVTDFIFFHWKEILNAPIFNLADLSITCGVIILALLMWRENTAERAAAGGSAETVPAPPPAVSHE